MDIVVTSPPGIIGENEPVVEAIKKSHQAVFGMPVTEYFDNPTADTVHLISYGVPALTYGPAGKNPPGLADYGYGWQGIEDLMQCTRVYALAAMDICSRKRN